MRYNILYFNWKFMLPPNKSNLLLLKKQRILINNGSKLLEDKRSGLIFNFLELAKKGKTIENRVENNLAIIFNKYQKNTSFTKIKDLLKELKKPIKSELKIYNKKIYGVSVDYFDIYFQNRILTKLKPKIKESLEDFADFFVNLVKLEQTKTACKALSKAIERINQQINNLDIKKQQIENNIMYIKKALVEKENLEKATLIKIFN